MKLRKRYAKVSAAVLAAGLLITCIGCLIPDAVLNWKLCLIIASLTIAWTTILISLFLFRCPHCGKSRIPPLWCKEFFCPLCGK